MRFYLENALRFWGTLVKPAGVSLTSNILDCKQSLSFLSMQCLNTNANWDWAASEKYEHLALVSPRVPPDLHNFNVKLNEIFTLHLQHFFSSFLSRETVYKLLLQVWDEIKAKSQVSIIYIFMVTSRECFFFTA